MKLSSVTLLIFLISFAYCQFNVILPVTSSTGGMESRISINKKEVYVNVDLTQPSFKVCCKPNQNIFQIIYSFLSNPFFQINEYICPVNPSLYQTSQISLSSIGMISMNHSLVQYPQCNKGTLGLSKKSVFLNYLPINDHTIKIEVSLNQGANKISLSLGSLSSIPENSWVFQSKSPDYWSIEGKSIQLSYLTIDLTPHIVLKSIGSQIKIPNQFYQKIIAYYPSNQTCKRDSQKIFCLCESGIPAYFPKIILNFFDGQTLEIDSNICTLLFEPSQDQSWYFNVGFFANTIFYFDQNKGRIIIQKKQISNNQSSQLISLPIPLILNCAVILLLCIFASLVFIEIAKRVSGLSEISDENLRQYIMRRNLV